jgi:DNA repair ATPase RecN
MQTRNGLALPGKEFKVWAVRGGAVFGTVALLALSAPLVWAAVSAGAGLAALAGMAATGFAAFQAMPLAAQKLENRLLKLRKSEARTNPIEQLQNDCLRREQRLQSFRGALVTIGGQIENMGQMIEARKHLDPGHVLDRQERALRRMQQFYQANIRRLDEAHRALEAFRHQVKQKMFEWEFAQAGQVVMEALNPTQMEDLMQDLLTDEALNEVQSRFNRVFAELDVEMSAMDSPVREYVARSHFEALDDLQVSTVLQKGARR